MHYSETNPDDFEKIGTVAGIPIVRSLHNFAFPNSCLVLSGPNDVVLEIGDDSERILATELAYVLYTNEINARLEEDPELFYTPDHKFLLVDNARAALKRDYPLRPVTEVFHFTGTEWHDVVDKATEEGFDRKSGDSVEYWLMTKIANVMRPYLVEDSHYEEGIAALTR